jgi:antitoxin HicB
MLQEYPVSLITDGNSIIAEFPDVPEALTAGCDKDNALAWAQDALVVALSGYLEEGQDIPQPSKLRKGQFSVALPPLVATKLAIYQAMREQNIKQLELARRLHCDARQVRRLLDLDHHSTLEQLDDALHALGKRLVVGIQPNPWVYA